MKSREEKRQARLDEYLKGTDWSHIYIQWKRIIENFGIDVEPVFLDIEIKDEPSHGRDPELSWWPKNKLAVTKERLLDHLKSYPGTRGPIHLYEFNQGELETLEYLWEVKDDPERVCALLICASLFSRMRSGRGHYPSGDWPPFMVIKELYQWAEDKWKSDETYGSWNHACTDVIPAYNCDEDYKIERVDALVRFLAEEHCKLLCYFQPVRIVFS